MKIDLKKSLESYQAKRNQFRILEIPSMRYLMVDGHGDPSSAKEFSDAIGALFPMAYGLKFKSKIELKKDYVVPPLEGLWWARDMESFAAQRDKSQWDWTLMIMVPEWITKKMFDETKAKVSTKGIPASSKVRLDTLDEGTCIQVLHVGSFDDEGPILEKLHKEFIPEHGFTLAMKHHEIYFSDFRKVAQEKLRTILRQPVRVSKSKVA